MNSFVESSIQLPQPLNNVYHGASMTPSSPRLSRHSITTTTLDGRTLTCPEFLMTGVEMESKLRVPLVRLEKKADVLESLWEEVRVAMLAGVLFYYDDINDMPCEIVPLVGATVKEIDLICNNDSNEVSVLNARVVEECGPCFQLVSSAKRKYLLRCETDEMRKAWIQCIQDASSVLQALHSTGSATQDALTKSEQSGISMENIHLQSQDDLSSEVDVSEMLKDSMRLITQQKEDIQVLKRAMEEGRSNDIEQDTLEKYELWMPQPFEQVQDELRQPGYDSIRMSYAVDSVSSEPNSINSDSLQRQAMELADIARNLQQTFNIDNPMHKHSHPSTQPHINSATSSTPTVVMDHASGTSSHCSDNDTDFDVDSPLGDFTNLSGDGLLDSIHNLMQDFIFPPSSNTGRIIITDDVIAELRHDAKSAEKRHTGSSHLNMTASVKLIDTKTLRKLRDRSSLDESSNPYKLSLSDISQSRRLSEHGSTFDSSMNASPTLISFKTLELLLVEDSMAVVSSILQAASREEKTMLLLPLLRIFGTQERLSRLIRWAIESEVESVISVATLFRSDDYASRLVSTYSKTIGSTFIKNVLTDSIHEIYKLSRSDVELDIERIMADNIDATTNECEELQKQNATVLMNACQMILDAILNHQHEIPSSYYHICSHLNAKVINRFDGSMEGIETEDPVTLTRAVIGGFLFLRFVCPAITSPHLHDLIAHEPTSEIRRILVLITKLIFKSATSIPFDDREPQFCILNEFIERNAVSIQQLFTNLSIAPSQDIDTCFASDFLNSFSNVSSDQHESDLDVIRSIVLQHVEEIEKRLSTAGCSPQTTRDLRAALNQDKSLFKSQRITKPKKNTFLSNFTKMIRKRSDSNL